MKNETINKALAECERCNKVCGELHSKVLEALSNDTIQKKLKKINMEIFTGNTTMLIAGVLFGKVNDGFGTDITNKHNSYDNFFVNTKKLMRRDFDETCDGKSDKEKLDMLKKMVNEARCDVTDYEVFVNGKLENLVREINAMYDDVIADGEKAEKKFLKDFDLD